MLARVTVSSDLDVIKIRLDTIANKISNRRARNIKNSK